MRSTVFTIGLISLLALGASAQERTPFSTVGLSLNAGLTGVGATVSTPLGKYFNARVGFGYMPLSLTYTTDELEVNLSGQLHDLGEAGAEFSYPLSHSADIKARLKVPAAHFLVDYNPFKDGLGAFHLTAGLFAGGNDLVHVNGNAHFAALQQKLDGAIGEIRQQVNERYPGYGDRIEHIDVEEVALPLADEGVRFNPDGTVDAYLKVNPVRPYFGLGWGNAIPKRQVGFRFDIGALYQGKPKVYSPNISGKLTSELTMEDGFNEILDNAKFWPQISFQLTFRLLKDK